MVHLESPQNLNRPSSQLTAWETSDNEELEPEASVSQVGKKGKSSGSMSSFPFSSKRDSKSSGGDCAEDEEDSELPETRHSI